MAITICDVGPRDGLQNDAVVLGPATRAELINRLAAAGLPRVEAVSFVNPQRVPAMAQAEEVIAATSDTPGTVLAGLVLNVRGYERLAATRLREAHFALAATETFNQRNQGSSPAESVEVVRAIVGQAQLDGRRITATISVAFGCPFEGKVATAVVLGLAEQLAAIGVDEIVFADTIGVGVPRQVRALLAGALPLGLPLGVHLHNTRNTGYTNAWVALEAGATIIDASIGGLGGCPFAPRATGNIATEDLIYMLDTEGVETGIELGSLLETVEWLTSILGRELPGQLYRAGPS